MRGFLRLVALLIYVGAGYLIGSLVGRLVLIPVAAVAHVSHGLQTGLSIAAGLLGIFSAVGWWRAKFGEFQIGGGVHGSAHFASAAQVKTSLGGAAGLIVGRENRKGGQLLEVTATNAPQTTLRSNETQTAARHAAKRASGKFNARRSPSIFGGASRFVTRTALSQTDHEHLLRRPR